MIREALEFLHDLSVRGKSPVLLSDGREKKRYFIPQSGQTQDIDKDAPARSHQCDSLADLIALALRFKGEGKSPVVWFNENAVELVINDGGHRDDRVVLDLRHSDLFATIAALDPKQWHQHKPFIRLLRVDLFGALDPSTLLEPVRRVRFENGVTTRVENTRVKESLGRDIISSVKTDVETPDYVILRAPVYATQGVTTEASIKAAFEMDPSRGEFQLAVLPDEIDNARSFALDQLRADLAAGLGDSVPFWRGAES